MPVVFLLSHPPIPRLYKRMQTLSSHFKVHLIFWDRLTIDASIYPIPEEVLTHKIAIKAPVGKWFLRSLLIFKFARKAIKELRAIKPKVIHCANIDMLMVASIYRLTNDKTVKLVYEIADLPAVLYNQDFSPKKHLLKYIFRSTEKFLIKNVSFLILTSPYYYNEYYNKFISKEKVLILLNTPEKELFSQYTKQYHNIFTIGFIGSIRYPDQLKMLIDVVGEFRNEIRILIAGDGPAYNEIKKYCKDFDYITIYGPYNYNEEIIELYQMVDCVYSVYDTSVENVRIALPNRLYEAIVCELPIIVASDTKLADFVCEQGIGFSVADSSELTQAFHKLLDPEVYNNIQQQLRAIKENYFYDENNTKLISTYQQLQ